MNDFNIQAASSISGVTVHQMRAWERRYNAISPKREGNNFRSYSQEDIARLKLLGVLTRHGISISKIASLNTTELQSECDFIVPNERLKIDESIAKESNEKLAFLMSLFKARKLDILKHEVRKLHNLYSVSGVLIPLMKQVIQYSDFKDDEKKSLIVTLAEQISGVSAQACNGSSLHQ